MNTADTPTVNVIANTGETVQQALNRIMDVAVDRIDHHDDQGVKVTAEIQTIAGFRTVTIIITPMHQHPTFPAPKRAQA